VVTIPYKIVKIEGQLYIMATKHTHKCVHKFGFYFLKLLVDGTKVLVNMVANLPVP